MNPYESEHWREICRRVESIAIQILPHLNRKKIKSEVISNLFETLSGEYFTSIGLPTQVASNDREPDLTFPTGPCEIKVTGIDHPFTARCKWMGGKYSKRTSDYILIMWNYTPTNHTLYGIEPESIKYNIIKTFIQENEWSTVDNNKDNY